MFLCLSSLFSQSNKESTYPFKDFFFPDSCDNKIFAEIIRFNKEYHRLPTTYRVLDMSKIGNCLIQKDSVIFITRAENILQVDVFQNTQGVFKKDLTYRLEVINDSTYNLVVKYIRNKSLDNSPRNKKQKFKIRWD
jgi:hypothetical protein